MSATGQPTQTVLVILEDPQDQSVLSALPLQAGQLDVLLFTQSEYASEFTCG
jgi:hypothetical protein